MSDHWTASLTSPLRALLLFSAAVLGLQALPELPSLLTPLPTSPYAPLCPEVLVLVTALVYAAGTAWEGPVRIGALAGVGLVVGYQVYDAAVYTAFRRNGILYEDVEFVDNLTYFAADIATWTGAAWVGLVLIGCAVLAEGMRRGVRVIARAGGHGACRGVLLGVHLVAWPLVLVVGPSLEWGTENLTYQTSNDRVRVRTVATKAWANAQASVRLASMLDSLDTAPVNSAYAAYDSLSLKRRPPIYLVAVESYGTLLERHPDLRGPYRRLLRRTQDTLAADGWHMASARAEAPVQGGRSWLAIASLLTGVRVDRQVVYNRFLERPDRAPHLVRFLNRQGYHTVALQPFTYERPGLPTRNIYDFDVTLYRDDLQYDGPGYGLADAPDQYSLNFAHHTQLAGTEPYFLFFETVDSHALWNYGLPPVLPDWRRFNEVDGDEETKRRTLEQEGRPPGAFLPDSLTRPRIYDQPQSTRYLRHIAYDLEVLREHLLETAPDGSLVLLLGDHQPPLFDTESTEVPLHVLSTDASLVEQVRRRGFTDGLVLQEQSPRVRQEALYSMLVRMLAAHDRGAGADTTGLPPVQPNGLPPSILVQAPTDSVTADGAARRERGPR
ncbi:MAG: hypothetical protein ACLFTE_02395 [Salinivenus sp.]